MTGYGRASGVLAGHTVTVQVSSVNRRALDLAIKLPGEWESLEAGVAEQVRKVAHRGRISAVVELSGTKRSDEFSWDDADVNAVLARLSALAATHGVKVNPTPELLWSIANSQRQAFDLPPAEEAAPVVMTALNDALIAFVAMRAREGDALLTDFLARLATLRAHLEAVAARAPQVVAGYREQLLQRLRQAGLELDLNDERVLKEIALFADRCDIAEELTRLRSHLEQFTAHLKSDGEIGRKSEFILQEMGREVNTIGSKANDLQISRAVIELKNELERVKEQIANVE